jgi:hypothetical protein
MEITNALPVGAGVSIIQDRFKTNFLQLRTLVGNAVRVGNVISVGASQTGSRLITTSGNMLDTDCLVVTNGTLTLTLLTAVGRNSNLIVKNISATLTATIDGAGTETIDGAATKALAPGEFVTLMPYGAAWLIVG